MTVLGWTPDLYPNLTDTKLTRYTHRVLFFVVSVQHNINSKLSNSECLIIQ